MIDLDGRFFDEVLVPDGRPIEELLDELDQEMQQNFAELPPD